jgi:hypothetical protein
MTSKFLPGIVDGTIKIGDDMTSKFLPGIVDGTSSCCSSQRIDEIL